jgi:predicted dehydrogenase
MLTFGIIGLGPLWESLYFPALCRIRQKVAIRAVYDPVASRAEQVAQTLHARPYEGISALIEDAKVRAFLMLDPGWYREPWLRAMCAGHKPVYVAGNLANDAELMLHLYDQAKSCGQLVMPEMHRRYAPSTSRLHELMASRIGRPRRITIDAEIRVASDRSDPWEDPCAARVLMELFDWCRYVTRTQPATVSSTTLGSVEPGNGLHQEIRIEFTRSRQGGEPAEAALRVHWRHDAAAGAANGSMARIGSQVVECDRGTATLYDERRIEWQPEQGERADETLSADRSAVEVMLDQFCRRVAGGLLPVADLADVCRGLRIAKTAAESLGRGEKVPLSGLN